MSPRRVVFIHPDLGIGGAERLIVDAAIAMQQNGYDVKILTSHHDENHCFAETKDGTVKVECVGDWLPRSVFGFCFAACAYLRMIYVSLYLVLFSGSFIVDLIVCDLVSVSIPFLKLFTYAKILFYCHYPDQLLTERKSILKRLYRAPLDWFEEKTTGMADCILVNSNFTAGVFRDTFRSIDKTPKVLYPPQSLPEKVSERDVKVRGLYVDLERVSNLFLSINRYERKKNVGLAIEALTVLKEKLDDEAWNQTHLVVAGGYDERVVENIEYLKELKELALLKGVRDRVTFLRSFSDVEKRFLLDRCSCLVYTPDKEHFGIVPIEAMHAARPVVAVNSGGPMETVLDGETGFLCSPNSDDFANAMFRIVDDRELASAMGNAGKLRVREKFSFEAFKNSLNDIVTKLLEK